MYQRVIATALGAVFPPFGGQNGVTQVGKPCDTARGTRPRLAFGAPFAQDRIFPEKVVIDIDTVISGLSLAIAQHMETDHFRPPAWLLTQEIPDLPASNRAKQAGR